MSDRKTDIKNWIVKEMEAIIADGHYTGPQSVFPEWFLPSNALLDVKPNISPLSSVEEITDALNGLVTEKRLYLDGLQVIEGKIRILLKVP